MNTKQIRIRLEDDDLQKLQDLAGKYHMQHGASLASILVKAGLSAIESNHGRMELPLRFSMLEGTEADYSRLN